MHIVPSTIYANTPYTVRVISLEQPPNTITAVSVDIGWTSFGLMRKHVSTTRLTYLAAVLQDASKSYVAFLLLCTILCYALGALGVTVTTSRHLLSSLRVLTADDTLFRKVRYSSHHLLHTLLPEQTNHPYHLRSRTHSFKLSSQHDERNFIDRMLFKNANPVCTHSISLPSASVTNHLH